MNMCMYVCMFIAFQITAVEMDTEKVTVKLWPLWVVTETLS